MPKNHRFEKFHTFNIKAKYARMKNGDLLEGVHKNVLSPFPITEFLKLNSAGKCDM